MLPTVKYHERLNVRLAAAARKRRRRALALRDKGKSWAEIGEALGISRARAKQIVDLASVERRAEDAEADRGKAAEAATAPGAAVTA